MPGARFRSAAADGNSACCHSEGSDDAQAPVQQLPVLQILGVEHGATGSKGSSHYRHDARITACAFATDRRYIVSASDDRTLRLWDADTGECLRVHKQLQDSVRACAFAPDGRRIVSGSDDGTLRFRDAETGKPIGPVIHHFKDGFAVLDPAANRIVQTGGDGWRHVGWQAPDPITGQVTRYPAEIFGPLPEFVPPAVGREST